MLRRPTFFSHPGYHSRTKGPFFRAATRRAVRRAASLVSLGPTISVQAGRGHASLSITPQIWGDPQTSGSRNLDDFEKLRVRATIGTEF